MSGSPSKMMGVGGLRMFLAVQANLLVERVGYALTPRSYTEHKPYMDNVSLESSFSVRQVALVQMERIEAREVELHAEREKWEAETPARGAAERQAIADSNLSEVQDFFNARCLVSPEASESDIVLRAKYGAWSQNSNRPIVDLADFNEAMDKLGYTERKGKRQDIRLKIHGEMRSSVS